MNESVIDISGMFKGEIGQEVVLLGSPRIMREVLSKKSLKWETIKL